MQLPKQQNAIVKANESTIPVTCDRQPMYDEFIEFLAQIYWDGYAGQLAQENPEAFQAAYIEFFNAYIR